MAEIGNGYGSECHLLRYLGRHRELFDGIVRREIAATAVRWLDFHFDPSRRWMDGERKGIDFLPSDHPAHTAWAAFWPQRGNPPNWDAVGVATFRTDEEWLLVEAKAHLGEMCSDCQASEKGGLAVIRERFGELKRMLGVAAERDWLHRYYQFANRLAVLSFLTRNGVPARLLFVYFVGDRPRDGAQCPQTEGEWKAALAEQASWLGLERRHALSDRIHSIFVPTVMR